MCRLLGFVAPRRTSFADVIGQPQCDLFQVMARLHDDGWGTMWVQDGVEDGRDVRRLRVPGAGHDDNQLASILRDSSSRAMVAHLRLATRSMRPEARNTHPFLGDGVGMAHNGAIVPTPALRAMVPVPLRSQVHGSTDSELYFAVVRQELRRGLPLFEAAAAAVARIRQQYPDASLNAMLLTRSELVVVHASSTAPVPYEDFTASAVADNLPRQHDEAYFRMSYRRFGSGSLAFTSAGLDTREWTTLPQDTITRVDVDTLDMRTQQLASGRQRAEARH